MSTWLKMLLLLHYVTVDASKIGTQEILIRAHDGVVAQPAAPIIITSDSWLHTFEIALPEKPSQQQIDKVAINIPQNRNRFAPVAFFHSLAQESIALSADAQCQANASSFQNTGTLIDCAPGYNYVNAIKYIWRFKNLKYIQEIHQLVSEFIPEISKTELRKKKRSFWHFLGAATTEDVKILEDNIRNLQSATEISLRSFAQLITGQIYLFHEPVERALTAVSHGTCETDGKLAQEP
jgi:hypothetical protein